jgi:hypothetical protein
VCVCVCVCMCVCVYKHTHTHTHARAWHTHANAHTDARAHAHTHAHTLIPIIHDHASQVHTYTHICAQRPLLLKCMSRRLCPCVECELEPVVDTRTWRKHTGEIARGVRDRTIAGVPKTKKPAVGVEVAVGMEVAVEHEGRTGARYAMEMSELVSTGAVNVTGMQKVLQSTSSHFQSYLPEPIVIPKTWYLARKIAVGGKEPLPFTRDFCPKCDHLFGVAKEDEKCPNCAAPTRYTFGKATRQAQYFDVADKCARLFATKYHASRILPATDKPCPTERPAAREISSAFDGSILQELYHDCTHDYKEFCLYFTCCNDGVEVTKGTSYTPITAELLNLPSELRGLLASIWLLGYVHASYDHTHYVYAYDDSVRMCTYRIVVYISYAHTVPCAGICPPKSKTTKQC